MKPYRSLFLRSFRTLAAMAIALATSTGAANAAVATFTVDESAVGAPTNPDSFQANGLTSKYLERVTLNTATGEFSGNLVVAFTNYTLNGLGQGEQLSATLPAGGEIAANENRYAMYALVSVSGTFTSEARPNNRTLFSFILDPTGSANVFLDPNRDTGKDLDLNTTNDDDDLHILTASTVNANVSESFGLVLVNQNNRVITGSFALVFTDPTLLGVGPTYWPTLDGVAFQATASGDVDPFRECANCIFPSAIAGDASIAFEVPEPASMSLLGLGLLGTGFALRRRRRQAN